MDTSLTLSDNNTLEAKSQASISSTSLSKCLTCASTWYSCRKCQNGGYPPVLVPFTHTTSSKKLINYHHRQSRFYVKLLTGINTANDLGKIVRAFTLSESDYALGMGIEFGSALKLFEQSLKREFGLFPFAWVEHLQGDRQRLNRHFILYDTPKLSPSYLDDLWHKYYGSKITGLERVWSPKGMAFYLAKYMGREGAFRRARFSNNWVFPHWWSLTREYYKKFGEYPTPLTLTALAEMSDTHRPSEIEWLLNTGYLSKEYKLELFVTSKQTKIATIAVRSAPLGEVAEASPRHPQNKARGY